MLVACRLREVRVLSFGVRLGVRGCRNAGVYVMCRMVLEPSGCGCVR